MNWKQIIATTWVTLFAATVTAASIDVQDYGAYGNGVSNDTVAIQAAVDDIKDVGGTIEFPAGTYMVNSVNVTSGLTFKTKPGDATAVIKTWPTSNKWTRCFTTTVAGYLYLGDMDSEPLVFTNLNFDGNLDNQGPYDAFELEHQASIFLAGDRNKAGRLVSEIVDCNFVNGVADAIAIHFNVDATIQNCSVTNFFRGGFTATGGNTEISVTDFFTGGDPNGSGIDVEVDATGYGGSGYCGITVSNLTLGDGDFDIGFMPQEDGSYFVGDNITLQDGGFTVYAREARIDISNSEFHAGSIYNTHIYYMEDVTFRDCVFYALRTTNDNPASTDYCPVYIYPNIGLATQQCQSLLLENCEFKIDGGFETNDTIYAIRVGADRSDWTNTVTISNCTIDAGYTYGIYAVQGSTLRVADVAIAADTAVLFGASSGHPMDVVLDNVSFEEGVTVSENIVTSGSENDVTHRNMTLDEAYNTLSTMYGIAGNTYHGGRLIMAENPPSSSPGLLGDRYLLNDQTSLWRCTVSSPTAATWTLENLAPVVENTPASTLITESGMELYGELDPDGGWPADVFLYWGETDGVTDTNDWDSVVFLGLKSHGLFHTNVTISANEQYWYRYYASNSVGGVWASSSDIFSAQHQALTYTAGANGSISGTTSQTVIFGTDGTAVTAVPDTHYVFIDWSDSSTENPRTDLSVTVDVAVMANFAIQTYTLNYTAGANGSISGTTSQTVDSGTDGTAVTAVPAPPYVFIDWSDSSTENPRTDTSVTADVNVTASFSLVPNPIPYTETFEAYTNGYEMVGGADGWMAVSLTNAVVTTNSTLIASLAEYSESCSYPLPLADHAKVLEVSRTVSSLFDMNPGQIIWADYMMLPVQAALPIDTNFLAGAQAAVGFTLEGHPAVWHYDLSAASNRWSEIDSVTVSTGEWVRLTFKLDYQTDDPIHSVRYFKVYVDGACLTNALAWTFNDSGRTGGGSWFAMSSNPNRFNWFSFITDNDAFVALDDFVVTTANPLLTSNGVPFEWMASHGLTNGTYAAQELLDIDSDGMATWKEWVCDTDPVGATSLLQITNIVSEESGMRVDWKGGKLATQYLERKTDLVMGSWVSVFTNNPPTSVINNFIDSEATNVTGFYRVKASR